MTRIHISALFGRKADQKAFKKSCSRIKDSWFVYTNDGVWFFSTEMEAQEKRAKLKSYGVCGATVHHIKDIDW